MITIHGKHDPKNKKKKKKTKQEITQPNILHSPR